MSSVGTKEVFVRANEPFAATEEVFTAIVRSCGRASACWPTFAGGGPDGAEGDGIIDGLDFISFINSFAAGDVNADLRADVAGGGLVGLDPGGIIDSTDFIIFINVFAAGC